MYTSTINTLSRDGEGLHEMTNRDGEGPHEMTTRDGEGAA